MSTQKQIEANRLNAQKSTGPRTEEGKRASSLNALKSGLDAESQFVLGESREEFADLQAEYFERFQPTTPETRYLVDCLIRNEWFLRRFFRVESHLWEYNMMFADRSSGVELGEVFVKANAIFMRLQRRVTAAEKSYKDALTQLRHLQSLPEVEESQAKSEEMASFPTPPSGDAETSPQPADRDPSLAQLLDDLDSARRLIGK